MAASVAAAPNRGAAFAAALCEELARGGLRHVCVCPGSRSAPLAVAAAARPELCCWSHLDERSAGFFALGLAKAGRAPVALVCTSGTAAANFLPAVVEAHYARVPLLVLTADRPPELREWGAGQTIDQVRLYGPHVRWYAEAPVPEATPALLRHARALACRALAESGGAPPGPVHLNLPFREPLEPTPVPGDVPASIEREAPLAARGRGARPYTVLRRGAPVPTPEQLADWAECARANPRGVIACGPDDAGPDLADAVVRLARATGWPVIADGASGLRRGEHVTDAPVVATADWLLRDAAFAARCAPDLVLRFGAPLTSKAFRLWLERHPPAHWIGVDPDGAWLDPSHLASEVWRVDPLALCDGLARKLEAPGVACGDAAWRDAFAAAERRASEALERALCAEDALLEPQVVRELAQALPDGAILYVSNSMPIRDLDGVLPVAPRPLRVLCNRGANGIDGMLSSALGAAAAGAGPVVLLTGDLAFLHDVGALVGAHRHALRLTVVLLDNGGGGIFSLLPIARHGEDVRFEELFRTPHGLDLAPVCHAFGARFTRAATRAHLRAALKEAESAPGLSVVAVPIDPDRNVAHHRALERAVRDALAGAP